MCEIRVRSSGYPGIPRDTPSGSVQADMLCYREATWEQAGYQAPICDDAIRARNRAPGFQGMEERRPADKRAGKAGRGVGWRNGALSVSFWRSVPKSGGI